MLNKSLTEFDSVIWTKWTKDNLQEAIIIGYAAEDGHPYTMVVPPHLRDSILKMQNTLAAKYAEVDKLSKQFAKAIADVDNILNTNKGN